MDTYIYTHTHIQTQKQTHNFFMAKLPWLNFRAVKAARLHEPDWKALTS